MANMKDMSDGKVHTSFLWGMFRKDTMGGSTVNKRRTGSSNRTQLGKVEKGTIIRDNTRYYVVRLHLGWIISD